MKVTVTLRAPYSLHPFHSISDTFSLSSSRGGSKTCYDKNSARRFSENFSNISPSISVISEGGGIFAASFSLRSNYIFDSLNCQIKRNS